MIPAPTGVLVATQDRGLDPSWLAMISADDGNVIWEEHLGNGRGIAVAHTEGGSFLVVAFDVTRNDRAYEESVTVRKVTADGQVGLPTIIRTAINDRRGFNSGALSSSSTNDGAYVVSSWEVPFELNPALLKSAEIAKVDIEGRLVWRTEIPASFVQNIDRGGAAFCSRPAVATLQNGDGLVACALKGKIYTHTFNRLTAEDKQATVPLPACNDGEHPVALSLFVRPDGKVLVSGTRPSGNVGPGCSWLARLPTDQ